MVNSKSSKKQTEEEFLVDESQDVLGEKVNELSKQVIDLSEQLKDAKHREQLALADYQNLIRRTNKERSRVARLAARNFIEDLIQPLGHLTLASEQLNDSGLNMVLTQLWQVLEQNGLKKIDAIGKNFDVESMEATESGKNGKKVIKVVSDGYTLNDEVIQHVKVVLD